MKLRRMNGWICGMVAVGAVWAASVGAQTGSRAGGRTALAEFVSPRPTREEVARTLAVMAAASGATLIRNPSSGEFTGCDYTEWGRPGFLTVEHTLLFMGRRGSGTGTITYCTGRANCMLGSGDDAIPLTVLVACSTTPEGTCREAQDCANEIATDDAALFEATLSRARELAHAAERLGGGSGGISGRDSERLVVSEWSSLRGRMLDMRRITPGLPSHDQEPATAGGAN